MTTPPLIGRGHVTIIKGEYPAARGMTTSPLFGRGHVTIIKGEYPAARGMTTSPGVPSTGDVYVAPARLWLCNNHQGRVPRCAGHDDLARYSIDGRRIRRPWSAVVI